MIDHLTLIANPKASSGLGGFVGEALREAGCNVRMINAAGSKWDKLWPVMRSWRWNREAMWRARWENLVFSSWAWDRNTRRIGYMLDQAGSLSAPILMVGKEYYPHPRYREISYMVLIHTNMRCCLREGKPWVPPRHDIERFLERETNLYRHAVRVLVGATYLKESLVKEYGVDHRRVSVIGGGAHPYFEQHAVERVPDRFSGKLLFVGWDFGMKGGRYLLEAFAVARRTRPGLELRIVGPDASQWVEQPGVRWLGAVNSKQQLLELYRESDALVMPSLCDSFGFVFLEAMTQGLPCMGTEVNAMPEIIEHGKTGYVVTVRDSAALAKAMLDFYRDDRNRASMGAAALRRVKSTYTWRRVAHEILMRNECGMAAEASGGSDVLSADTQSGYKENGLKKPA